MQSLFIPMVSKGEIFKVFLEDINYIEKKSRKIDIYTANGVFECHNSINSIHKWLDNHFYKCHSHLIVNFQQVDKIRNQVISFLSGEHVTMGVQNFRHTKVAYKNYLEEVALNRLKNNSPLF